MFTPLWTINRQNKVPKNSPKEKRYCRLILKLDNKSAKEKTHGGHATLTLFFICSYMDSA
jgi:hypothetical protein